MFLCACFVSQKCSTVQLISERIRAFADKLEVATPMQPDGTAIQYDLGFHAITLLFSYLTISAIAIGSYVFGYMYLGQGDQAAEAVTA